MKEKPSRAIIPPRSAIPTKLRSPRPRRRKVYFCASDQEVHLDDHRDLVLSRFNVRYFVEEHLLEGFLKRLKQVQLLTFFEKISEIIAPRQLIVDFMLGCRVKRVSSVRRQLTYNLRIKNVPSLRIEITRESFAEMLQLPVVRNNSALQEYSLPNFEERVEWLGERYFGPMCTCPNSLERIGPDGLSNCASCSSNLSESFWITNEIKDPSIRDLFHFTGLWLHNRKDTSCLRRAAVDTLNEALVSATGKQIWTQHLWTNFLWDLEKVRAHAMQNKPYECHASTAGLVSTIICTHISKSPTWIQAMRNWESSTFSPGMKTCKSLLKQLREGDELVYETGPRLVYNRRSRA